MQVPFSFFWTPAAPAEVLNCEPFTAANTSVGNRLLYTLVNASQDDDAHLNRLAGRDELKPLWVRELSVTADYGVVASVAYKASNNTVYPLYTSYGPAAGNGGHAQPFRSDGIYVPQKLRLQLTAGNDADGAKVFHVAGHFDVEELPA